MQPLDKKSFDIPESITYLNCAYISPLLHSAVAAGEKALRQKLHPWEIYADDFFAPAERLRTQFSDLMGIDREGVFLCTSASFGLSTAASVLSLSPGKKIMVLDQQFPSNVYPWMNLTCHQNGKLVFAQRQIDETWTEAVTRELNDKDIEIMALPHCHWTDGALLDLVQISSLAKQRNIKLVLDLSQSLGANPIDLRAIDPDFMLTVGYKWLLGPMGHAFGYVAERWRDAVPMDFNWINRAQSEDFSQLVDYRDNYQPGARRFDIGGKNPINFAIASAALDQIKAWGIDRIKNHTRSLTNYLCRQVLELGMSVEPEGTRSPHLVGIKLPNTVNRNTLATKFAQERVFVSVRGKAIRVSPHVYNSTADIDCLVSCLASAVRP